MIFVLQVRFQRASIFHVSRIFKYSISKNLSIFHCPSFTVSKVYSELRLSAPAFGAKYERTKPGPYDEVIFYCKFGEMAQVAAETALSIGFRK